MLSIKKIEDLISIVLIVGIITSAIFVLLGGIWYLHQHGHEAMISLIPTMDSAKTTAFFTLSFSPLSLIEIGLFLLLGTQIARVGLLAWFYSTLRDYWFAAMSFFILAVLIYSLFCR